MGKRSFIVLALILAVSLLPVHVFAAEDAKLTIIHVNDRHGRMGAEAYIAQMLTELEGQNVLLLDAGDSLHGQTATNLSKGEAMVSIMNTVGYSAMVPGNHDFNFGVDRLLELRELMEFPLLSANVMRSGEPLFDAYKVFELDGLKVGVFGLSTPETVTKSDPRIVAGLDFLNPVETAKEVVNKLKADEGCDIIVALTHLGIDEETLTENRADTVAAVEGIDIVIDGHSHTVLENGRAIGETLLAQTGAFAEYIGVVTLAETKTAKLIKLPEAEEETELGYDAEVLAAIEAEDAKNEAITGVVVGHTPVKLQGEREDVRVKETNLANLLTDSMRWATGADVAFMTGGNIRASIEEGDITMGDALTTLPFSNLLATLRLSGADLLAVLEHGVSLYPEAAGQNIQVSGISFDFDPDAEPLSRVYNVRMANGDAFDADTTYTVATIEFITAGGDGYTMMLNGTDLVYYQGDVEALVDYLATEPGISAEPEGRITPKAKAAEEPVAEEPAAEEPVAEETAAETPAAVEPAVEPAVQTPAEPEPEKAPEAKVYIVQPGDHLTKIAGMYNTTWRELQRLNNIKDANLIYPDQVIILPAS